MATQVNGIVQIEWNPELMKEILKEKVNETVNIIQPFAESVVREGVEHSIALGVSHSAERLQTCITTRAPSVAPIVRPVIDGVTQNIIQCSTEIAVPRAISCIRTTTECSRNTAHACIEVGVDASDSSISFVRSVIERISS